MKKEASVTTPAVDPGMLLFLVLSLLLTLFAFFS